MGNKNAGRKAGRRYQSSDYGSDHPLIRDLYRLGLGRADVVRVMQWKNHNSSWFRWPQSHMTAADIVYVAGLLGITAAAAFDLLCYGRRTGVAPDGGTVPPPSPFPTFDNGQG